eukprot:6189050-Pleurochrysis_carterae.AAC.2
MARRLLCWIALLSCVPTVSGSLGRSLFIANEKLANVSLHGQFMQELAQGTLDPVAFDYYLKQDDLYLSKYARAFALLAASSTDDEEFVWLTNQSATFLFEHDRDLYRDEATFELKASPVTFAYTNLLLQAAWAGDRLLAIAAALPCQVLYEYVFSKAIQVYGPPKDNNPYKKFMMEYANPENHAVTLMMEGILDSEAANGLSTAKAQRAGYYYATALRYEAEFFAQGLRANTILRDLRDLNDRAESRSMAHSRMSTKSRKGRRLARSPARAA